MMVIKMAANGSRFVSHGSEEEEEEEDEMVMGNKEALATSSQGKGGGGRTTIAASPQQDSAPPSKSRQQKRRQRQEVNLEATTTTRQRRSTSFFILLLSSALTLALSSLYFSTTLTSTTRISNEDQQNNPAVLPFKTNPMDDKQQQLQQQPEISAPDVPASATKAEVVESKTIRRETKAEASNIIVTNVSSREVAETLPLPVEIDNENSRQNQQQSTEPDVLTSLQNQNTTTTTAATTATTTRSKDVNADIVKKQHNNRPILEHPYWGARDEHGQSGHVHDPTVHRRPFTISNQERNAGLCNAPGIKRKNGAASIEGGDIGAQALQKIQISSDLANDDDNKNEANPIRLFCALYTHTGAVAQTNALLETWAPRCDGLLLASNATNTTTHHVHIPHKSVAEGKYKGIWQRVRAMMAYLYQNFLNDYDYFHFCGDDTFLLVENLKAFLSSAQVANATNHGERPLFAGYWAHLKFWGDEYPEDFYFLSGGPGYTLSRSALKVFVEEALPTCRAKKDEPFEDLNVAWCFYHMLNISGIDTRDETGAQRYHPMSAEMHAKFPAQKTFGAPSFMVRKTKEHMEKEFGFPIIFGLDDISSSSVAFHYLKTPVEMRRYEMLLYGTGRDLCNNTDSTSAMAVA